MKKFNDPSDRGQSIYDASSNDLKTLVTEKLESSLQVAKIQLLEDEVELLKTQIAQLLLLT